MPCRGTILLAFFALGACADDGGRVELLETDQPRYEVTRVLFDDPGARAIQLALSSYEPVRWEIAGEGAPQVAGVFVDGFYRHEVTGAPGATVINVSGHNGRAPELESDWGASASAAGGAAAVSCAYTYPGPSGGGCAAGRRFVAEAEAALHATAGSFTGVYNGAAFRIPDMSRAASD